MELKQLYDETEFKKMLDEFHKEYVDKREAVYDEARMKKELEEYKNKQVFAFCLVDEHENKLGFVSVKAGFEESHIASVCRVLIKKEYRGAGLGKIMLLSFEKYLAELGVKQLILGSRRGREKFYLACGFEGEGLIQGDCTKISKEEMEEVLEKYKIKTTGYMFYENTIHQFYFDAKEILENSEFATAIDKSDKMNLIVVFTKNIGNTKEKI